MAGFLKITVIIAIVAILLIVASYSMNGPSKLSHKTTICNQDGNNIRIVDQTATQQELSTVEFVADPHFKSFITSVEEHVASEVKKNSSQKKTSDNDPIISLTFIRLALTMSKDRSIPDIEISENLQSSEIRQIGTPWLKIVGSSSENPALCGIFLWNERQFLIDQALMSGASVSQVGSSAPMSERSFRRFIRDYTNSVLLADSPEAESNAQKNIAQRLPAEVLWLFRHAWQSTLAPFPTEVDHALRTTVQMSADGYTNLTKTLLDQFFTSTDSAIHYASVLDLENIIPLDQYQVDNLH